MWGDSWIFYYFFLSLVSKHSNSPSIHETSFILILCQYWCSRLHYPFIVPRDLHLMWVFLWSINSILWDEEDFGNLNVTCWGWQSFCQLGSQNNCGEELLCGPVYMLTNVTCVRGLLPLCWVFAFWDLLWPEAQPTWLTNCLNWVFYAFWQMYPFIKW